MARSGHYGVIRGNYGVISGHVGLITGHCVSFGETKVHRVRHKVLSGVIGGHWGSLGVIGLLRYTLFR